MKTSIILLCSGTSSRMFPFEDKFLFEFLGKSILERKVEELLNCKLVEDIYIVGNKYNIPILQKTIETLFSNQIERFSFLEQEIFSDGTLDGMKGGILSVEKACKKDIPICIVSSNDIVDTGFLEEFISQNTFPQCDVKICGKTVNKYFPGGYLEITCEKNVKRICEKPGEGNEPSNMINLVFHWYRSSKELFDTLHSQSNKNDDAYELSIQSFINEKKDVRAVEYNGNWQSLKYPWYILDMKKLFLSTIKQPYISKDAYISSNSSISGNVVIEKGVKIHDFAVVQGPCYIGEGTIIGNHSLVRNSHIGKNCCIGQGTEVARSYLRNNVFTHQSYIGDSVIDSDVNFGAGCRTGNLRHDGGKVSVMVKKEHVNSGKEKLGIFCGKGCKFGINTSFSPGICIGKNTQGFPHIFISKNIPINSYIKPFSGNLKLEIKKNKHEFSTK